MHTQTWKSKKALALQGTNKEKIERHIKSGKKTARQRIELLVDSNSFEEIDQLVTSPFLNPKIYTDGVITGFAKVNEQQVALYVQDFSIKGGSLGKHHAQKICKIMDLAAKIGCPIIGIIDSGGARIDEGIHALGGYGEIFMRNTRYSGIVPQISVVLGPCAGGAVYSPALTDFIFTTKSISQLFITGPQVIKLALYQEITKEELGGTSVHAKKSGVSHFVAKTEEECFSQLKKLLSYLPSNYLCTPPKSEPNPFESNLFEPDSLGQKSFIQKNFVPATTNLQNNLESIVPTETNKSYDVKKVIAEIADSESFFESQKEFAQNIVVGFARIDKRVIGIIANQPIIMAGALDINASCKAARFIRFCDCFGIPILSIVDVPGFLPGVDQEYNGIIRHGAKLLAAYAEATIPKITIILRKAFGGAYIVMGSKHLGADFNFAWPNAQIAVLGAQTGIEILHGKKLKNIPTEEEKRRKQKELEKNYSEKYLNPFIAAEYGYIDSIIEPSQTRKHIIKALEITQEKVEILPKRKHNNIPL